MRDLIKEALVMRKSREKDLHPAGFKPMTSLSWGVSSTAVLQPLPKLDIVTVVIGELPLFCLSLVIVSFSIHEFLSLVFLQPETNVWASDPFVDRIKAIKFNTSFELVCSFCVFSWQVFLFCFWSIIFHESFLCVLHYCCECKGMLRVCVYVWMYIGCVLV